MNDLLTAAASLATILSLFVATVQSVRVRRMQIERQRHLWALIASSKALMRHLERQDIHQAYGLASEYFRQLLRDASILEKDFDIDTIKAWRSVGKLSSDWQERQAFMLLSTEEILKSKDKDLPPILANFDNPEPGHPVAKQWVNRPPEYKPSETTAEPLRSRQEG